MTEKEMLFKIIESGKTMRGWQKAFFADGNKVSKTKRDEIMREAKKAEREFDNNISLIQMMING